MFKKAMTPLSVNNKKGSLHSHVGKGAQESTLPQRGALNTLVGSPQSPNNYAKATPMTAGPTMPSPSDASAPDSGGPF
jgi:hypothetical protein